MSIRWLNVEENVLYWQNNRDTKTQIKNLNVGNKQKNVNAKYRDPNLN